MRRYALWVVFALIAAHAAHAATSNFDLRDIAQSGPVERGKASVAASFSNLAFQSPRGVSGRTPGPVPAAVPGPVAAAPQDVMPGTRDVVDQSPLRVTGDLT